MTSSAILYPVFALALWTSLVLLLIPITRFRAGRRREIVVNDFKYGESPTVPPQVSIPNRNYMNLLEIPVLFYVVSLLLFVTGGASATMVATAWAYVALRVVHSAIHLTYNRVIHRLGVFAVSNGVLITLWVMAASQILAHTGAST